MQNCRTKKIQGIYAITPVEAENWSWPQILACVQAALQGGITLVQMRQKNLTELQYAERAQVLGRLCVQSNAVLLLNDAPPLAELAEWDGVAGVHLGRTDMPVAQARALWGDSLLIGASCYNQVELAEQTVRQGADHVAFGALYTSSTKPGAVKASLDLFAQSVGLNVPRVGIGGIDLAHLPELADAGADAVAVVSALFGQQPRAIEVEHRAKEWVNVWQQAKK